MYSDGQLKLRAIGPDGDFNAAMDIQLDLAFTRPITHSLPASTTFVNTY